MRFSIRDLLLVTVIVALATAWWVSYRGLREENESLRKKTADQETMIKTLEIYDPLYQGPPPNPPLVGPYSITPKGYPR